jgi:hypothetical protein
MRLKCLACEVLARPIYHFAASSPHIIDVELLERGLHNVSANLRNQLQMKIDAVDTQKYDHILLAYGLCGLSLNGIKSSSLPLVIPKAHDCITLFLGSRARYLEQFSKEPGTYWYTQDYFERGDDHPDQMPMGVSLSLDREKLYKKYVEKYGREKAEYLMDTMKSWEAHYDRAAFIDLGLVDGSAVKKLAEDEAHLKGWKFESLEGDLTLIRKLIYGDWDSDFLVVQPGDSISIAYDNEVVTSRKDS